MSLLTGLQKLDNCHCNSLICTRAFDIRSIIEAIIPNIFRKSNATVWARNIYWINCLWFCTTLSTVGCTIPLSYRNNSPRYVTFWLGMWLDFTLFLMKPSETNRMINFCWSWINLILLWFTINQSSINITSLLFWVRKYAATTETIFVKTREAHVGQSTLLSTDDFDFEHEISCTVIGTCKYASPKYRFEKCHNRLVRKKCQLELGLKLKMLLYCLAISSLNSLLKTIFSSRTVFRLFIESANSEMCPSLPYH